MPPAPVITVEGLGKRYTLHHQARSGLLRDRLAGLLRNPFRRAKTANTTDEEFWALRDVNFTVNQGDVVGIIGRNGAGKSTLLKILSRITEPTTGRIKIHGRIASLLEVGTGFHGELSGRENIFLNGAILGMKRAEIRQKFDEIVAFAEVEKFLDTPVKHYSSGMYVRLAFAVAAHLEPEILIVDEVLAVGDAAFQKKCLGKMQEVATNQGRTVLFVSHNLAVIQSLCKTCLLLERGNLVHKGSSTETIGQYLEDNTQNRWRRTTAVNALGAFSEISVRIEATSPGQARVMIDLALEVQSTRTMELEVLLHDALSQNLGIGSFGNLSGSEPLSLKPGRQTVRCSFPAQSLANGHYFLSFKLAIPFVQTLDEVPRAVAFDVELPPAANATRRLLQGWGLGSFMLDLQHH